MYTNPTTTSIYSLSLHDALPISQCGGKPAACGKRRWIGERSRHASNGTVSSAAFAGKSRGGSCARSEEHTSELQSHSDLVCRLLLEKKKKKYLRIRL